jgi:hypothetical protein
MATHIIYHGREKKIMLAAEITLVISISVLVVLSIFWIKHFNGAAFNRPFKTTKTVNVSAMVKAAKPELPVIPAPPVIYSPRTPPLAAKPFFKRFLQTINRKDEVTRQAAAPPKKIKTEPHRPFRWGKNKTQDAETVPLGEQHITPGTSLTAGDVQTM